MRNREFDVTYLMSGKMNMNFQQDMTQDAQL